MTTRFHDDVLNGAVDDAVDRIDNGSAEPSGRIDFYSGSPPVSLGGTPSGDLLASVNYQDPAFGDGGVSETGEAEAAGAPLSTTGADDGTIGFARVLNRDEEVQWDDDDVGTDGNNIEVSTTTVSAGVDFEVTGHTFSVVPQ